MCILALCRACLRVCSRVLYVRACSFIKLIMRAMFVRTMFVQCVILCVTVCYTVYTVHRALRCRTMHISNYKYA